MRGLTPAGRPGRHSPQCQRQPQLHHAHNGAVRLRPRLRQGRAGRRLPVPVPDRYRQERHGVFRSTGKGATWLRAYDDAHQWGSIGGVGVIAGDPDTYGRVYVGTNGRGLQYGDPS
ncbi:hypothetical protein MCAG_04608 [Micromonospora sp. ATCC 39149]|nr:hypothetical protein MCAG_04608 [Micromonospora sp. ATCC 39149]